MYNRSAFKQEAKQLIRARVPGAPHFMLVAFVYYLLTTGLSTAVSWLVGEFSTPHNPSGGILGIFLTILVALFSAVMGIGFVNYSLRLARREPIGWSSLFQAFSYSGRAIGLTLMLTLFICLWGLLIFIGVMILAVILIVPAVYSPIFIPFTVVGIICLYAGEMAVLWFILLRYSMAEYVLTDNPDTGVMESIRRSIRMMRGYKWKLFVMHLSFLGWELLVALIVLIVVTIGFFISGTAVSMVDLLPVVEDPERMYRWSLTLVDQMKYWVLLGSVLSLPLSLWLLVYKQTALARFYNYVGGYDYHQYMNACQAQAAPPPTAPPVQPAPEPKPPAAPPAGGYYTPQPDVSEPPAQPETPVQPEPPNQPAPPSGLPAPASDTPDEAPDEEEDDTEEI